MHKITATCAQQHGYNRTPYASRRVRQNQYIFIPIKIMSTENKDQQAVNDRYIERVDAFIKQANQFAEAEGADSVSSSLLYAATRFSAFNASRKYTQADKLAQDKTEALKYFSDIFRKMFQENMEDYIKNFDNYFKEPDTTDS